MTMTMTMSISNLPDIILLKIFENLPLPEVVRLGRVDQAFHRLSRLAISRLQSIHVDQVHLGNRKLDAASFGMVMDLCYGTVKRIKLGGFKEELLRSWDDGLTWTPPDGEDPSAGHDEQATALAAVLCLYMCPKLVELDIRGARVSQQMLHGTIRNCPSLRCLSYGSGTMPHGEVLVNLESVQVRSCDEATLRSFVGSVPNLRRFSALTICHPTAATLNDFCQHVPNLRSLELRAVRYDFKFNELRHLFNLSHLESLTITKAHVQGPDLIKVAQSFPRLKKLQFTWVSPINDKILDELSKLEHLRVLKLDSSNIFATIDEAFQRFMTKRGSKLREVYLPTCAFFSPTCLITAVRATTDFELGVFGVRDMDGINSALQVLEACRGVGPRKIQLKFKVFPAEIWRSMQVKEAIKKLKDEEGVVVEVGNMKH